MIDKIINFSIRKDFGTEYYLKVMSFGKHIPKPLKGRTVIQLSIGYDNYYSWPYMQITSGSNSLFGVLLCVYRYSFSFDLLGYTWNFSAHDKALEEEYANYPDPWY